MKAVLMHCTTDNWNDNVQYLCFFTWRCYSPLSHMVSHQHYHITSIWHYHNDCQHEIHWDYEKAVNAPIKTVGPSRRANTCLLIALTSGLWEQSCNAKQKTKSLISHNWCPEGKDHSYPPALLPSNAQTAPLTLGTLWGKTRQILDVRSREYRCDILVKIV